MLFRFAKSFVFFALLFFSLRYLGATQHASLMVALIPLVLGLLDFLASPAFGLTTLVFIGAALSALLPAEYSNAADFVQKKFAHVSMQSIGDTLQSARDGAAAK